MKPAFLYSITILAVTAAIATPAHADVVDNLLNKLRAKGILSEVEYQEMRAEVQAEKKGVESEVSNKSDLIAKFKDRFLLESKDKQNSLAFIGRVHADYRAFTPDISTNPSTFEVRRAYLGVKGKVNGDVEFEVSGDFAGTPELKKAWVNFDWIPNAQLRIGQFTMPFGLETMMSSNKNDFQEPSLASQLTPDDEPGVMVYGTPFSGFTYALALSNGAGANKNAKRDDKDRIARFTFNLAEMLGSKNLVTHLGLAYSDGIQANGTLTDKFRSEGRSEATIFQGRAPGQIFERTRAGLELALAYGPFKLQGEKIGVNFRGNTFNRSVDASYISGMWMITGESWADTYKNGEFDNIKPAQPVKKGSGNLGAWALGLRYSKLNTNNFTTGTFTGTPGASASTFGLNWIPNNMTRIMLNYVYTQYDTPIAGQAGERAITMRTQISW